MPFPHHPAFDQFAPNLFAPISLKPAEPERLTDRLTPPISPHGSPPRAVSLSGAGPQLFQSVKSSTVVQPPPTVLTSMTEQQQKKMFSASMANTTMQSGDILQPTALLEEQKRLMLFGASMMLNTMIQSGDLFLQPNGLSEEQKKSLLFGTSMMANTMPFSALPQMKRMAESQSTAKLETSWPKPEDTPPAYVTPYTTNACWAKPEEDTTAANMAVIEDFVTDIGDVMDVLTMMEGDDKPEPNASAYSGLDSGLFPKLDYEASMCSDDSHDTQLAMRHVAVLAVPADQQDQDDAEEEEEDAHEGPSKKKRRAPMAMPRWSVSHEQKLLLEEFFAAVPMPSRAARTALAEQLGVSSQQVKVWFRNQRQRTRLAQRKTKS
jgi:hypothetical protein